MLITFFLQIISAADSVKTAMNALPVLPRPKESTLSFFDLVLKGGYIMIPIFICSVITLYIVVERYLAVRKAMRGDINFMNNIRDFIQNGNIESAKLLCRNTHSPVARMIEKGISRIGKPLGDIEKAIENVGNIEVVKLERGMSALATCASAAPMLGFLGTVTGMVRAFYDMKMEWDRTHESINIGVLSGGMFEAMITTVAGLIVGIVAMVSYNVLSGMIKKAIFKMESSAIEFLDLLQLPSK
jgi:biopolymer transport protein ExbB